MRTLTLTVTIFGIFGTLLAQDTQKSLRLDNPTKPAFVVICDSSPDRIIVLDELGKWVHRVKEAEIRIEGQVSTIKCLMYEGTFRPSNPEIKVWKLIQIKSVPDAEFQSLIDGLQTDPDAVKKKFSSIAEKPIAVEKPVEKPTTDKSEKPVTEK